MSRVFQEYYAVCRIFISAFALIAPFSDAAGFEIELPPITHEESCWFVEGKDWQVEVDDVLQDVRMEDAVFASKQEAVAYFENQLPAITYSDANGRYPGTGKPTFSTSIYELTNCRPRPIPADAPYQSVRTTNPYAYTIVSCSYDHLSYAITKDFRNPTCSTCYPDGLRQNGQWIHPPGWCDPNSCSAPTEVGEPNIGSRNKPGNPDFCPQMTEDQMADVLPDLLICPANGEYTDTSTNDQVCQPGDEYGAGGYDHHNVYSGNFAGSCDNFKTEQACHGENGRWVRVRPSTYVARGMNETGLDWDMRTPCETGQLSDSQSSSFYCWKRSWQESWGKLNGVYAQCAWDDRVQQCGVGATDRHDEDYYNFFGNLRIVRPPEPAVCGVDGKCGCADGLCVFDQGEPDGTCEAGAVCPAQHHEGQPLDLPPQQFVLSRPWLLHQTYNDREGVNWFFGNINSVFEAHELPDDSVWFATPADLENYLESLPELSLNLKKNGDLPPITAALEANHWISVGYKAVPGLQGSVSHAPDNRPLNLTDAEKKRIIAEYYYIKNRLRVGVLWALETVSTINNLLGKDPLDGIDDDYVVGVPESEFWIKQLRENVRPSTFDNDIQEAWAAVLQIRDLNSLLGHTLQRSQRYMGFSANYMCGGFRITTNLFEPGMEAISTEKPAVLSSAYQQNKASMLAHSPSADAETFARCEERITSIVARAQMIVALHPFLQLPWAQENKRLFRWSGRTAKTSIPYDFKDMVRADLLEKRDRIRELYWRFHNASKYTQSNQGRYAIDHRGQKHRSFYSLSRFFQAVSQTPPFSLPPRLSRRHSDSVRRMFALSYLEQAQQILDYRAESEGAQEALENFTFGVGLTIASMGVGTAASSVGAALSTARAGMTTSLAARAATGAEAASLATRGLSTTSRGMAGLAVLGVDIAWTATETYEASRVCNDLLHQFNEPLKPISHLQGVDLSNTSTGPGLVADYKSCMIIMALTVGMGILPLIPPNVSRRLQSFWSKINQDAKGFAMLSAAARAQSLQRFKILISDLNDLARKMGGQYNGDGVLVASDHCYQAMIDRMKQFLDEHHVKNYRVREKGTQIEITSSTENGLGQVAEKLSQINLYGQKGRLVFDPKYVQTPHADAFSATIFMNDIMISNPHNIVGALNGELLHEAEHLLLFSRLENGDDLMYTTLYENPPRVGAGGSDPDFKLIPVSNGRYHEGVWGQEVATYSESLAFDLANLQRAIDYLENRLTPAGVRFARAISEFDILRGGQAAAQSLRQQDQGVLEAIYELLTRLDQNAHLLTYANEPTPASLLRGIIRLTQKKAYNLQKMADAFGDSVESVTYTKSWRGGSHANDVVRVTLAKPGGRSFDFTHSAFPETSTRTGIGQKHDSLQFELRTVEEATGAKAIVVDFFRGHAELPHFSERLFLSDDILWQTIEDAAQQSQITSAQASTVSTRLAARLAERSSEILTNNSPTLSVLDRLQTRVDSFAQDYVIGNSISLAEPLDQDSVARLTRLLKDTINNGRPLSEGSLLEAWGLNTGGR